MDPLGPNFIDLNLANVVFLLAVGFIWRVGKRLHRFRRRICAHTGDGKIGVPGIVDECQSPEHRLPRQVSLLPQKSLRSKYTPLSMKNLFPT